MGSGMLGKDPTVLTGRVGKNRSGSVLAGGERIFPTKHPFVKNEKGGVSNVRLISVGFGDKTYAIPSMVDGKQLSDDEAVAVAKKQGISKYPSFDSVEDAEGWIQLNHGNIDAEGRLTKGAK